MKSKDFIFLKSIMHKFQNSIFQEHQLKVESILGQNFDFIFDVLLSWDQSLCKHFFFKL